MLLEGQVRGLANDDIFFDERVFVRRDHDPTPRCLDDIFAATLNAFQKMAMFSRSLALMIAETPAHAWIASRQ